jgi:hypothetical protein
MYCPQADPSGHKGTQHGFYLIPEDKNHAGCNKRDDQDNPVLSAVMTEFHRNDQIFKELRQL